MLLTTPEPDKSLQIYKSHDSVLEILDDVLVGKELRALEHARDAGHFGNTYSVAKLRASAESYGAGFAPFFDFMSALKDIVEQGDRDGLITA